MYTWRMSKVLSNGSAPGKQLNCCRQQLIQMEVKLSERIRIGAE